MTQDEKKKIYTALAGPFPEHCIQRTEGRVTGRGYDTTGIGYQHVANRLNEVLGLGGWRAHRTVTVKEIATAKGRQAFEATCDITLELGDWIDGQFVAWAESLADGGHTAMSEADARKGAYTNAFKKAAAFLGCGKQAYEGSLDDDNLPEPSVGEPQRHPTPPAPSQRPATNLAGSLPSESHPAPDRGQGPFDPSPLPRTAAPTRNRLSSKQLSAIWALGRKLGYEQSSLRSHIKKTFGVQPEFMTRDQASQAIGALANQAGNGHADSMPEPGAEG